MQRYLLIFSLLLMAFCSSCKKQKAGENVFKLLPPAQTHVDFINKNTATNTVNILDYLYFYNGAGVASADFNNDGLPDLYFVSNQESNKLYLNKGNLTFEDITAKAGVAGTGNWKTGVTIVDINGDGYKDIYISVVSNYKSFKGKNQLFINNHDLTFTESAAKYGLDFSGFSTQASFTDYDKDGDLDMFLLTSSVHSNDTYGDSTQRFKCSHDAGDHLFRNDNGHFTDVTKTSGIYAAPIGYGLGVSVGDLNNDGWDDIYVSNDFFEQDYYYVNQHNGTFKE
ncbi:MAG: VCBS repeat-containing protein, partial [Sphingobacteriaceae bacterium]